MVAQNRMLGSSLLSSFPNKHPVYKQILLVVPSEYMHNPNTSHHPYCNHFEPTHSYLHPPLLSANCLAAILSMA